MRLLLAVACVFAAMLPAAAPPRPKASPAASDATIEQNIRARFAKSKIAEEKFTIRVQGGRATIEGNTSIIQRKGVATRLAKAGGATSVDNRIRIADDARAKAAEQLREKTPRIPAARPSARPADPPSTPEQPKPIPRAQVKH